MTFTKKLLCTSTFAVATVFASTAAQAEWVAGYAGGGLTHNDNTANDLSYGLGEFDVTGSGVFIFGGYNWQNAQVVYGVDASLSFGSIDGDDGTFQRPFGEDLSVSIMGRIGYDAGATLPWIGLGYQFADSTATHDLGTTDTAQAGFHGVVLALGVDYMVTDTSFVRVSVEVVDFEDEVQGFFDNTDPHDIAYEATRIKIGHAVRF